MRIILVIKMIKARSSNTRLKLKFKRSSPYNKVEGARSALFRRLDLYQYTRFPSAHGAARKESSTSVVDDKFCSYGYAM
ncbi:hypothetical protein D5086_018136 [Populus alba]|uniref:Uncharacterized protein n=1 Tax=Populus alba TaxID=43335 RepID=A0ACC4BPG5_POPAL